MQLNRARYVTICQQFLVTAAVLAVGLSAAGVMTLEIVAPGSESAVAGGDLLPAVRVQEAYVATKPISPKLRQVSVSTVDKTAERTLPATKQAPNDEQLNPKLAARRAPKKLAILTKPEPVTGFATVGVTWQPGINLAESAISIQVRSLLHGKWSEWTTANYHDDHGPDADTSEGAHTRPGTDALVVGYADKVQMRAETRDGTAPAGMRLVLIDPGAGQVKKELPAIDTSKLPASDVDAHGAPIEDTSNLSSPAAEEEAAAGGSSNAAALTSSAATAGSTDVALAAMKVAPKPQIFSRAQWGANEKIRDQSPPSYGTIKTGFVHHTVNANNYTEAQVPALIRGIYAYHVEGRGWRDIGYNFLVDRFGRIWEGRYGGVDRAVIGAHTLGYNEVSFAMSSIGNFDIAKPPQAIIDAYARLFAWKLSLYDIRADAKHIWVKNRYLNAINGHRDVEATACPGKYLYAKIPEIISEAEAIQTAAQHGTTPPPTPPPTTPPPTTPPPATGVAAHYGPAVAQPSGITFSGPPNLTGDAYPDLALQNTSTGKISLLPTGGQMGYLAPVTSKGPWKSDGKVFAVGDVTGDGKGDVIAQDASSTVARVYRGDGQGHVSATGIDPTEMLHGMDFAVGAGDLNKDGHPDIVARLRSTKALYLIPGKGHGKFGARQLMSKSWPYALTTVAGDLNKDGRPDLIAVSAKRDLYLIKGLGGARLAAPVKLAHLNQTFDSLDAMGDITGDGVADVLMRAATDGRTILRPGTGTGNLGHYIGPFSQFKGLAKLSSGQLAGNSMSDMVGVNSAGALVVVPHNGKANLRAIVPTNITAKGVSQIFDVGDWNGDGKGDLITRENGGDRMVLRLGQGNGMFAAGVSMGDGWKSITQLAAVGDVTGDKHPDLVGRAGNGVMLLFAGNGAKGFKPTVRYANKTRTYNQIGTGIWMSNQLPNTVFGSSDGSFVPFAGTSASGALAKKGVSGSYDWAIGVGDIDGNGTADLLVREKSTGYLWLLPGLTGGSGFAPRVYVGEGFKSYQLAG
jgi:uncharacterized protein with LGFP repeats